MVMEILIQLRLKIYSIKSEIEYEDAEGKTRVSDIIYVPALVKKPQEKGGIFQNPFLLAGAALALAALIYTCMRTREGGRGND